MTTATAFAPKSTVQQSRLVPSIGIAAGVAWLALGLESILNPGREGYRNVAFLAPWLLTIPTVWELYRRQSAKHSRALKAGVAIVLGALAVGVVGQPGLFLDIAPLKAFALLAFIGFLVGTIVLGVASYRAGILPKRLAVAVALTQVGTMAVGLALSPWIGLEEDGAYSGAVVHGIVFLSAGAWLWRTHDESA